MKSSIGQGMHHPRTIIRGCFDYLSHEWILNQIPTDTEVLRRWLKAGYVENQGLFPTEAGTPQGGIISPTLANMTLDGLKQLLKVAFRRRRDGAKQYRLKVNLIRYADDFIITGPTKDVLENEVRPLVEHFCATVVCSFRPRKPASRTSKKGLISSDKTSANTTARGFNPAQTVEVL